MAEAKTKPTAQPVVEFIKKIEDEQVRDDCAALVKIMQKASGAPAVMWGSGIIGFGKYHYKYDSGHEGDSCLVGFAPRTQKFALYIMNYPGREEQLKTFGKHKASKGCLYIKKLEDIDTKVLGGDDKGICIVFKREIPGIGIKYNYTPALQLLRGCLFYANLKNVGHQDIFNNK